MFTNGQEQSEQKDSETNNDATQGSDSTISRCIICSINRAKTRIDVRPEGSRSGRSDGGFSIYREYETTQNAFELKKERDRLENMLGIVASLRHASLEVGTLLKQRNVQPIVTVRGAERSFLCYPVGDDKLLVFYVDAAFEVPLRTNPLSVSTNSNELSSSNDNAATAAEPDDEVEADEMTKICADLHQLLIGVKFAATTSASSSSSTAK